ncbi:HEAT repeat domain-containing protein [Cytobacillus firmus]|uniref:HEAT repeat domain-containing protein n=1 Tax=Cytobacillus firmus TaxID=1399 RepID=UPI001C8DC7BB|nr:HEAT repeat domain-containing protein [Cytobacillus firmus]MBX9975728.1 HEAT repeat domain-containing protein [Cytobacillus firmus]
MLKNEIYILGASAAVISGVLLLILFYLVIRKWLEHRERRKINECIETLSPLIFEFISEGEISRHLHLDNDIKKKAAEEVLSKFAANLTGEEETRKLREFADRNLRNYFQRQLKSRRWSIRMNALYNIEDLHFIELQPQVLEAAIKERISHDERVQSLTILAAFQFEGISDLLLYNSEKLSDGELRNIILRLNENLFSRLITDFHRAVNPLKYAIIDAAGIRKELRYIHFIESVYASYEGETRLRAVKALSSLGVVKDITPYLKLRYSEDWKERMMAAKLFGSLKERELMPHLLDLLHDRSWWVRSQAGQSIMMFPDGKEELQIVLDTSNDSYARDMAWEWMNKGEFG